MIGNLNMIGFYEFMLPFMFILALTFGILSKSEPFGSNFFVYFILSISIAFFSVNYTPIGLFFTKSLTYTAVFMSGLFVTILVMGMFGADSKALQNQGIMWTMGILALILFFASGAGVIFTPDVTRNLILTIVVILLLIIIFLMAKKEE
jgi:hypothetical protein